MAATNWTQYPIGHGYITQYSGGDTPHFADDVETPFHTPITALWSGTVKQADYAVWSGQPGGGEVFIKPDNGGDQYYYYHLDELDVSPGQHVSAGQVIGLSGGQNSGGEHPVSPMWSSGPHTHVGFFEKYVNTPAGERPYGPDITSALENGAFQNLGTGAIQPLASLTSPAGELASFALPFSGAQVADVAYRVLFIVVGLVLLWLGLKHFIDLPNISIPSGQAQAPAPASEPESAGENEVQAEERRKTAASTRRYLKRFGGDVAPPPPAAAEAAEVAEL